MKNMKKMNVKNILRTGSLIVAVCGLLMTTMVQASALPCTEKMTSVKNEICAEGDYDNWEGVSNVSQFLGANGELCFAYDNKKNVTVIKTQNGTPEKKGISLQKKASVFGAIACDKDGNYYVVTGKKNKTDDTTKETVFISKYDKTGKLIATVGDNGSSSLAYYYDSSFYTKAPFEGGTCDIAVKGDYLAVNYARHMYSGHQSNSLFLINVKTMEKVQVSEKYYNSHSFAQRVVPFGNGFLLASEGDCYDRAFTVSTVTGLLDNNNSLSAECNSQNIFDFWISKGAFARYDMYEVNNNFAHMGGIAVGGENNVSLVATSVPSLNSKAKKEKEQLFIQIFNPFADLESGEGFVTSGTRSGMAGNNGDESVTNYGVKWLTNYGKEYTISNPQVVATDKGDYVILFERYKKNKYQGVYEIVVDKTGKVVKTTTRVSAKAYLNPYRMPVYAKGKVWWVGNNAKNEKNNVYIYSFSA